MVKALLCDIDGTLVQSNWLHAEAWQVALGAVGVHATLDEVRRQIGKGGDELVPWFVPWWKQRHVQEPLEEFRKFIFKSEFLPRVKPIPRVREFLLRLKDAGIRLALASSASKEDLLVYKKIADMEDLIEEESSADDADRSKGKAGVWTIGVTTGGWSREELLHAGCIEVYADVGELLDQFEESALGRGRAAG